MVAFFSILSIQVSAQDENGEMLQGGSMEEADTAYWTVEVIGNDDYVPNPTGDQIPEYMFGYTQESCSYGDGGALRVYAEGTGFVNIMFYQEVTLTANTLYQVDGAFKDLTGKLDNFWTLLKISLDGAPPTGENDGQKLAGFNTWEGCGQYADGTFALDACDSDYDGYNFTAPDSLGETFTAYFTIMVGMYTDDATNYPYDVLIDEVSLIDSVAAAGSSAIKTSDMDVTNLTSFPNPCSNQTTISYNIAERSNVHLSVYNLLGEKVATLINEIKDAGTYEERFDVSNISGNMLICRLELDNKIIVHKLNIIR